VNDPSLLSDHARQERWLLDWGSVAALIGLIGAAFFPVLGAEFVNWDDDKLIEQNELYRGLGWTHLRWMFTTFDGGHYHPLTWLTFALDHCLWKLDPRGYHLTNLILHAAAAVVFFRLARRLFRLVGGTTLRPCLMLSALAAAMIFAVHPLRVESVAWVTERRDVLSGALFFAALLAYVRYAEYAPESGAAQTASRPRGLATAAGLYALCLLAKAAALGMPLVLLTLDVYPLRRLGGAVGWFSKATVRVWLEKIPFALLAVVAGVVALSAQSSAGALHDLQQHGVVSRVGQAAFGLVFYLRKTVYPFDLGPIYEIPPRNVLVGGAFWARSLLIVAVSAAAIWFRRRWPAGLALWICYLVLLAPVLGITQAGRQVAADRYSYLACSGWALLAGGGVLRVCRASAREDASPMVMYVTGVAVVILAAALGLLTHLQSRVWRDSVTLWRQGIAVSPESAIAQVNLADALAKRKQYAAAIEHYRAGLRIDPRDAIAHNGLGVALLETGDANDALHHLQEAVRLDPDYVGARFNLAYVLSGFGRWDEAAAQYAEVLRRDGDFADARINLSHILSEQKHYARCADVLEEGVQRHPDDSRFAASLAWLLATCPDDAIRDGSRAVTLAEQVVRESSTPDPWALDTLAAALAEAGRFEDAVATTQEAERLARAMGQLPLADAVRARRELYESGRAYRDTGGEP
jgi:tetratricopeptide (TPR) repeat protein